MEYAASIIIAVLGSSAVTALVSWLLGRRSRKIAEAGTSIELSEKVKELIDARVKEAELLRRVQTEKSAAEFTAQLLGRQLASANEVLKDVLIEQGKAEEREKQCNERLSAVEIKVRALTELDVTNQRQASEILQLRARIDELTTNENAPAVPSNDR